MSNVHAKGDDKNTAPLGYSKIFPVDTRGDQLLKKEEKK